MIAIAVDLTKWVEIGKIINPLSTKILQKAEYFLVYRQIKKKIPQRILHPTSAYVNRMIHYSCKFDLLLMEH